MSFEIVYFTYKLELSSDENGWGFFSNHSKPWFSSTRSLYDSFEPNNVAEVNVPCGFHDFA